MNGNLLLALTALLPLALGTSPASGDTMSVTICSGTESRTLEVPIPGKPPTIPGHCAAKACHAGCNRKEFDPTQ
ncbi:hypothetical protein F7D01_11985 [Erythrobacter sp. 3-20A1M]|uniref:hypothetical protein n=1 Tax=Erythrobacter sp. 3-20A1M TaxID=2653850 RepID=UPI001BFC4741|nr:hypothetical protein [Erythrobacter sp. 3-20A1M]QWC57700.1 hypothetical protein F7D01_11985 [Erythrobacter sp. 3-20A1M]